MKTVKTILIAILILIGLYYVAHQLGTFANAQSADPASATSTCPKGSYEIGIEKNGQPICKLEPTGCPYGDSIPLGPECDKHKPQHKDPTPPDPDRDYYGECGNLYSYDGKLKEKGYGCDSGSGQIQGK